MTTPQPAEAEARIETKDYWEIICLMSNGFSPCDVKAQKTPEGESILVFWFPLLAKPLYDDYCMMKPIPVKDIRDVERAARVFKSFKHRLSHS